MTPECKKMWIAALRSGQYKQGKGALSSESGFCCLGVALDVLDPTKWSPPSVTLSRRDWADCQSTHLKTVARTLNIHMSVAHKLATWNDGMYCGDNNPHSE